MSFVGETITKMADKMAAAYQFVSIRCCGHSNLVSFNRISSKFHIWFASVKPWSKFDYEFCQTIFNQDGWQKGRGLSVCVCLLLWSLLVQTSNMGFVRWKITKMATKRVVYDHFEFEEALTLSSSKFDIWTTFIKLLFISEYGFFPMTIIVIIKVFAKTDMPFSP